MEGGVHSGHSGEVADGVRLLQRTLAQLPMRPQQGIVEHVFEVRQMSGLDLVAHLGF